MQAAARRSPSFRVLVRMSSPDLLFVLPSETAPRSALRSHPPGTDPLLHIHGSATRLSGSLAIGLAAYQEFPSGTPRVSGTATRCRQCVAPCSLSPRFSVPLQLRCSNTAGSPRNSCQQPRDEAKSATPRLRVSRVLLLQAAVAFLSVWGLGPHQDLEQLVKQSGVHACKVLCRNRL